MADIRGTRFRAAALAIVLVTLAACEQPFDMDFRSLGNGFDTSNAVRLATEARPQPDDRGVLSYPNFQVAVARPGDRLEDIAERVGIPAGELSRYNGIGLDVVLRANEVVALPRRVAEPSPATDAIATGPIRPKTGVDISALAGDAIARASSPGDSLGSRQAPKAGKEPIRHKIEPGESAYSISRLYNVSVRALAEWNGLGADLSVRSGQYLLIPVAAEQPPQRKPASAPGAGTPTPEPPSAATPLPDENAAPATTPASPDLGDSRTAASGDPKLVMPTDGNIIRSYVKGKNDGIDIAAAAGTPVRAAADGIVAAITRDTDQVPIIILRHADNLLTVYAGVDNLTIEKGDRVTRGQIIAKVRDAEPSFLHFEVRQGLSSVDPMDFLS